MATNQPTDDENPQIIGVEPVYFFDGTAIVPPVGTMPPPRPAGMERKPLPPGTIPGWEFVELDGAAVIPPPGTKPPPRPPGKERRVSSQDAGQVAVLITLIESALETIHAALAEIKQIQSKAG
ncbi:MAG: hypothetical protein L0241_01960 [Planctomycetia bacterium]|nr:hypothetical protein [Planctomycetia bacterium]